MNKTNRQTTTAPALAGRYREKPSFALLQTMTWDELDRAELLQYVKETHPELYEAKYLGKFGKKAPGTNKMKPVNGTALMSAKAVAELKQMTWDELDRAGKLAIVKQMPGLYAAKYMQKFGKRPDNMPVRTMDTQKGGSTNTTTRATEKNMMGPLPNMVSGYNGGRKTNEALGSKEKVSFEMTYTPRLDQGEES